MGQPQADFVIAGIDPGASGAIAFFAPGQLIGVDDLPYYKVVTGKGRSTSVLDIRALDELVAAKDFSLQHIFYEEQIAGSGQSTKSVATTFRNLGNIDAWLSLRGIAHTCVHSSAWKARMLRGMPKGTSSGKGASVRRCLQLFPEAPVRGPRGGLLHDRAEAVLIAVYGWNDLKRLGMTPPTALA